MLQPDERPGQGHRHATVTTQRARGSQYTNNRGNHDDRSNHGSHDDRGRRNRHDDRGNQRQARQAQLHDSTTTVAGVMVVAGATAARVARACRSIASLWLAFLRFIGCKY